MRIRFLILLPLLLVALSNFGQNPSNSAGSVEYVSIKDPFTFEDVQVEKISLLLWDLMDEKRFSELQSIVVAPIEERTLKDLRSELEKPIWFSWRFVRTTTTDGRALYSYFVSLPQYYGDPEREPFFQIKAEFDPSFSTTQLKYLALLSGEEIEHASFNSNGFNPDLLGPADRYKVRNRTIGTVLDSLARGGAKNNFAPLAQRILRQLNAGDEISEMDSQTWLDEYTYSRNSYFKLKILLPFYNENLDEESYIIKYTWQSTGYYLRDVLLTNMDAALQSQGQTVFDSSMVEGCPYGRGQTELSPKKIEKMRRLIEAAETPKVLADLLEVKLPEATLRDVSFYCAAFNWIEERKNYVKTGEVNYSELADLGTIIVYDILALLSAAAD